MTHLVSCRHFWDPILTVIRKRGQVQIDYDPSKLIGIFDPREAGNCEELELRLKTLTIACDLFQKVAAHQRSARLACPIHAEFALEFADEA